MQSRLCACAHKSAASRAPDDNGSRLVGMLRNVTVHVTFASFRLAGQTPSDALARGLLAFLPNLTKWSDF